MKIATNQGSKVKVIGKQMSIKTFLVNSDSITVNNPSQSFDRVSKEPDEDQPNTDWSTKGEKN